MKTLKTLITCLFLLTFLGCEDDSDPSTITVERYVELLKKGKYDADQLPEFSSGDIPALLAYRNESQLIKDFPVNTLSSSLTVECTLGMFVLWTIESIRARAINSKYLFHTFPSQNPVVEKKEDLVGIQQSDAVRGIVAQSYFDWWETNKNKDFDEFKEIDPVTTTPFRWH
ncbi:uncharacterized protein DUF4943 [Algoriphagus ratkowskyi]|uniref:DUF4943 domain-containing protein n=1 Tax=Algoriphagus ratkowskyi TaxID=57028 RepID=A0A2W7QXR7_9BACT|nr:DUF4943 family protein [Algoriphagus ratkowskyi]PZX53084.1 uncharacterized protein DUF4943 [Algoriphagus ratkowskyi]TXD76364.1 DUF4943 domain-containing protein [Algoriphagus ratkowskyi]